MFNKATTELKSSAYIVSLGEEESALNVFCYQKEDIGIGIHGNKQINGREVKESLIPIKTNEPHCQNPKCFSVASVKFNGEINLCYKCVDTLREWKTNYELGTIFRKKEKILKLFKMIEELNPPKKEIGKEMIRCSNIYCGTLDRMTKHHLIPKNFRHKQTVPKIPLCEDCHKKVHQLATNQELAETYNTKQSVVELLAKDKPFRIQRVLNVYESLVMAVA